jgi:hypothetical protein
MTGEGLGGNQPQIVRRQLSSGFGASSSPRAGVVFIPENGGGAGVRLRVPAERP